MRGHGGAVDVRSEPGSGSVFTLLFPVSERPRVRQHEASGLRQDPGGSGTVLVVDDEQVVREVTERMLTTSGFEAILAEDGHRALEVLTTRPGEVDVVLLDLTLPHMDGMTIFREIRKILPDLPVVLASGFSEQEAVGQFEGGGQGLSGFVQKPFRMDNLAATIRRALGNEPTKGITRGS
jgi:two-component system cell cycle sensor histidine kinase/response regulator CckA